MQETEGSGEEGGATELERERNAFIKYSISSSLGCRLNWVLGKISSVV